MTTYLSDFKRFGFRRSEIVPFLKVAGIDIAQALDAIRAETPRAPQVAAMEVSPPVSGAPDWHVLVATWDWLNIDQCAHVMLDQSPIADYGLNYFDNADDWHLWHQTLEQACKTTDSRRELRNTGNGGALQIAPKDLIDWCQRSGYRCPLIPPGDPLPSNHAALAARCVEAERQRDTQRARAEKAETERDALNTQGAATQNRTMPVNAKETDPAWKMLENAMRAETARLDALRKHLEGANTVAPTNVRWPWGEYTTPALEVLATMAQRYVTNGTCDAKAEAIKADVQTAGMSERIAEGISQMLRADSESNRKLTPKRSR